MCYQEYNKSGTRQYPINECTSDTHHDPTDHRNVKYRKELEGHSRPLAYRDDL